MRACFYYIICFSFLFFTIIFSSFEFGSRQETLDFAKLCGRRQQDKQSEFAREGKAHFLSLRENIYREVENYGKGSCETSWVLVPKNYAAIEILIRGH